MTSKPFYRTPPSYPYTLDGSLIFIISEMVDLKVSSAAIITRPPEILACLKMAVSPMLNIFIIFDSHPRPQYADGAGLLVFGKLEGAARALTELFPVVDLSESGLQWQAQLLSNYSAHILVPRPVHDRQAHFRHGGAATPPPTALMGPQREQAWAAVKEQFNFLAAILEKNNTDGNGVVAMGRDVSYADFALCSVL